MFTRTALIVFSQLRIVFRFGVAAWSGAGIVDGGRGLDTLILNVFKFRSIQLITHYHQVNDINAVSVSGES